jgi:hypothetical protein
MFSVISALVYDKFFFLSSGSFCVRKLKKLFEEFWLGSNSFCTPGSSSIKYINLIFIGKKLAKEVKLKIKRV